MKTFTQLWNETENFEAFTGQEYDTVNTYNLFMVELRQEAKKFEGFDERKWEFYCDSFRYNAQQELIKKHRTAKQFCAMVYDNFLSNHK